MSALPRPNTPANPKSGGTTPPRPAGAKPVNPGRPPAIGKPAADAAKRPPVQNRPPEQRSPAQKSPESQPPAVRPPENRPPEGPRIASGTPSGPGGGLFGIYKKGQGKWTRIGTAVGVMLIAALTAWKSYEIGRQYQWSESATLGISSGLFAVIALFGWLMMNKPRNVDFLIATDSEMKKVNWTSKKELFGSTKVVVFFMFLIAGVLFAFDLCFGYFFWIISVLKSPPV